MLKVICQIHSKIMKSTYLAINKELLQNELTLLNIKRFSMDLFLRLEHKILYPISNVQSEMDYEYILKPHKSSQINQFPQIFKLFEFLFLNT